MASPEWSRIYKIMEELNRRHTIPSFYKETLEERLVITCNPLGRQQRRKEPRAKQEIRSHYTQKKAQRVYLEMLDEDPHVFLPFVLAISPKACESFDISRFRQCHEKQDSIHLSNDAKSIFEDIARRRNINGSLHYKRLIGLLFPQDSFPTPKPITNADSDEHWAYYAADLKAIRNIFGDRIYDAVESAPIRTGEKAKNQNLQTTECVRTNFPRQSFQDAVVWLDIGFASELASILFPRTGQRVFSTLPLYGHTETTMPAVSMAERQGMLTSPPEYETEDHAYFTLLGASVSTISSIFSPRVCDAIEKSQLRMWEKDHLLLDTTDCVTMEVCRRQPHHGTIRLRIGFVVGTFIANNLYAGVDVL